MKSLGGLRFTMDTVEVFDILSNQRMQMKMIIEVKLLCIVDLHQPNGYTCKLKE